MYLHTQSKVQVPCLCMFYKVTSLLNGKVAPEHQKVWKVKPESLKYNFERIKAKRRLTLLLAKGAQVPATLNWKRGKFAPLGDIAKRLDKAITGQMLEFGIQGIVISLISLLLCIDLDHFSKMTTFVE